MVAQTQQKYAVYYAERLHNEAAWHAGELIKSGAIGRVLQVINLAPHRLAKTTRPDWFFDKQAYGGILTDIGSHQVEQFLTYSGATDADINFARACNLNNSDKSQYRYSNDRQIPLRAFRFQMVNFANEMLAIITVWPVGSSDTLASAKNSLVRRGF